MPFQIQNVDNVDEYVRPVEGEPLQLQTPSVRLSASRHLDDDPIMNKILQDAGTNLENRDQTTAEPDRHHMDRPLAPIPVTKLTAETDEEILEAIKDYAEYNLVTKLI